MWPIRYGVLMRRILALSLVLTLAACGDDNREAGGVTKAEAEALDNAAARLDQSRPPVPAEQPAPLPEPSG